MDELIDELMKRAGLSEAQARAAARVLAEWLKHDDKRKKLIAAVTASMVAAGVV
jgi:hypothetical protein